MNDNTEHHDEYDVLREAEEIAKRKDEELEEAKVRRHAFIDEQFTRFRDFIVRNPKILRDLT